MAESVLDAARRELGTKESPANSNRTKYGKWMGLDGQPWCMSFVQWCFHQAGRPLPCKTGSCNALLSWYRKNRPECVVPTPRPEDIIIYNFGHTGIVESAGAGTVTAIEGNTSPGASGSQSDGGMVCRRTRKASTVKAYIRPEYEEEEAMPDFSRLTDAEVLQLLSRLQAVQAKQPISAALAKEWAEAKALGITDGTSPNALATRAQTAAMVLRAKAKEI